MNKPLLTAALVLSAGMIYAKLRQPRFSYPDKWAETGLPENLRISRKGLRPRDRLPVCEPDLSAPDRDKLYVTWFGHSSVLVQMCGLNILIDPMFSEYSSPVKVSWLKRFLRPSVDVSNLPHIHAVLLTHDHYDHLDKRTVRALIPKSDRFIVSNGVERHLRRWGVPNDRMTPLKWWESVTVGDVEITCTPSRHFSGRGPLDQNTVQWCSFVLRGGGHRIFDSGDGSIGGHFDEIRARFGGFDLALMECGQYNHNWHYSHLYPEESVSAAQRVGAKLAMPIHWGAFVLSNHGWDDPPERFTREAEKRGLKITTPRLCETVCIDDLPQTERWWRKYR